MVKIDIMNNPWWEPGGGGGGGGTHPNFGRYVPRQGKKWGGGLRIELERKNAGLRSELGELQCENAGLWSEFGGSSSEHAGLLILIVKKTVLEQWFHGNRTIIYWKYCYIPHKVYDQCVKTIYHDKILNCHCDYNGLYAW